MTFTRLKKKHACSSETNHLLSSEFPSIRQSNCCNSDLRRHCEHKHKFRLLGIYISSFFRVNSIEIVLSGLLNCVKTFDVYVLLDRWV